MATVPLEKDAMEGPFPLEDLALEDATGNNVGTVSAEIPVGPRWCEIRQAVFGWTTQKFPFSVKTAHALKIREPHVITVTGKAFYDIGHAPADHSNRRSTPKGYAVWESRCIKIPLCNSHLYYQAELKSHSVHIKLLIYMRL